MKTKNVGLTLVQFQCKDGATKITQGLDKKLLKINLVRSIEPNGKVSVIKHQEGVCNEEMEVAEVEQVTFPAQETIDQAKIDQLLAMLHDADPTTGEADPPGLPRLEEQVGV